MFVLNLHEVFRASRIVLRLFFGIWGVVHGVNVRSRKVTDQRSIRLTLGQAVNCHLNTKVYVFSNTILLVL